MKKKVNLLNLLQAEIESIAFKNSYRKSEKDFTRTRVFTFSTIIIMQINIISRSLSVEISKFLGRFSLLKTLKEGSKQAYSQARKKIKWSGYVHLNDLFIKSFYADTNLKRYKDKYVLIGTDGTTYELPYERELIDHFGVYDNGQGHPICMAQGLKYYDLLNHLNLAAFFEPYAGASNKGQSERACFEKGLAKFSTLMSDCQPIQHNFLFVGDKYYPSFYNFYTLSKLGYSYIFRCKANFCKEVEAFCKSDAVDEWITLDLTLKHRKYSTSLRRLGDMPQSMTIRCVKKILNNGEVLCLVTNVGQDLSTQEVCDVFFIRWKEETSFDTDKNKLEVENFSSKTLNGVKHDFYATILTANIAQLVISEAQDRVNQEQAKKNNLYPYQINTAVAIGIIKDEIPNLLTGQQRTQDWFERLVTIITKHKQPVRKNRIFKKKRKHKLKYPINRRRVL